VLYQQTHLLLFQRLDRVLLLLVLQKQRACATTKHVSPTCTQSHVNMHQVTAASQASTPAGARSGKPASKCATHRMANTRTWQAHTHTCSLRQAVSDMSRMSDVMTKWLASGCWKRVIELTSERHRAAGSARWRIWCQGCGGTHWDQYHFGTDVAAECRRMFRGLAGLLSCKACCLAMWDCPCKERGDEGSGTWREVRAAAALFSASS
jgi:hypothetical protein